MPVTIKDIAKLAGVSPATVSLVLNKKDSFISEATRQRINDIVAEQGYTPNPFARSLVTKQSMTIGVLVPDVLNPFFAELIDGCDDAAHIRGYNLLLCKSEDNDDREQQNLEFLTRRSVDGILLVGGAATTNLNILGKGRTPFVVLDKTPTRYISVKNYVGVVRCDDRKAAYMATNALIKLGHMRIAFLCGAQKSESSKVRYQGYQDALQEAGIDLDPKLVGFGEYLHKYGYAKTKELLISEKFSAICCMSDLLALGAMRALRESGVSVPKQCAVIGSDNSYIAEFVDRPLSVIDRHAYDMGSIGMNLLIDSIEGRAPKTSENIINPEIILRSTT